MQRIWGLGMSTETPSVPRDCAKFIFAYCLNVLRESPVESILDSKVSLDANVMTARVYMVKGKQASQVVLVSYTHWNDLPGPVDLWKRWKHERGNHLGLFSLDGEQEKFSSGEITTSINNSLSVIVGSAAPGRKLTYHSRRVRAHTEQVLLGMPR